MSDNKDWYIEPDMSETEFRQAVGKSIKTTLDDQGIKPSELAKMLNITKAAVLSWLNGSRLPTLWGAYRVSSIMNDTSLGKLLFNESSQIAIMNDDGVIRSAIDMPTNGNIFGYIIPDGDESCLPVFNPGDIVIASQELEITPGKYAIVKGSDSRIHVAKVVMPARGNKLQFHPINKAVFNRDDVSTDSFADDQPIARVTGFIRMT